MNLFLRFSLPCVFLLMSFSVFAQDRNREAVSLAYAWNPDNEFTAIDAKLAVEFWEFRGGSLSASLNVREADLKLDKIDSEVHLKSYRLSLPGMSRVGRSWFVIASPGVAVRNASSSFVLDHDTVYPSAFFLANYRSPDPSAKWSFGFGLIYSLDIQKHFFLPIVGASYSSPPWKVNLGFPNFGVFYMPKDNWEIGLKANFDSSTYTLPESSALRNSAVSGVKVRIIDVGPVANFKLSKNVWLNTNLGIVALAEAHAVSNKGTHRYLLYKGDMPIFARVSLSYYGDYKQRPGKP